MNLSKTLIYPIHCPFHAVFLTNEGHQSLAISLVEMADRAALKARYIKYAAPKYRTTSNIQTFASMIAPRPKAAEMDQMNEPAVIPDASASPDPLPEAIDVPAIASVAGPGLAAAKRAAIRIKDRLMSRSIVSHSF